MYVTMYITITKRKTIFNYTHTEGTNEGGGGKGGAQRRGRWEGEKEQEEYRPKEESHLGDKH